MSAAEVEETYGDRIRRAPAVVNAGRHKSNNQAASAAAGDAPQDGVVAASNSDTAASRQSGVGAGDGAMAAVNGHPAFSAGGPTITKRADSADGGVPATAANGTGLYQPRTSGRTVGGSLKKRFSDEQVGGAAFVAFATYTNVATFSSAARSNSSSFRSREKRAHAKQNWPLLVAVVSIAGVPLRLMLMHVCE